MGEIHTYQCLYLTYPLEISVLYFVLKYYQVYQVKEDEMGRACSTNEGKLNAYKILVENPEGTRPLGRPRRRWVGNIKMDLR
jgi:hypothetical protein